MPMYDVYGKMAKAGIQETLQNGRYAIQKNAESRIPADVFEKLRLDRDDVFLDIGCGTGINLFPAAKIVKKACGCDHPDVIERLKQKPESKNIAFASGNFTELAFDTKFTKILSYSVLHCLPDQKAVEVFVQKILDIMAPEGRALLGDIPNTDKKKRFLASERGKRFQKEWEALSRSSTSGEDTSRFAEEDSRAATFDDDTLLKIVHMIRDKGFNAYLVDQPQDLPFGNSREDLLIIGPEHEGRIQD